MRNGRFSASTTTMPGNAAEIWLTRKQAAWLADLSARQFDDAVRPLLPASAIRSKKNDLSFNAQAVTAAMVRYRVEQVSRDNNDPMLGAGQADSEWLEAFRKEQTLIKRLERLEKEGQLADLAKLDNEINRFGTRVRRAGELLQRRFGNEASDILNKAIDEAVAGWQTNRGRGGSSDGASAGSSEEGDEERGQQSPGAAHPDDAPVRRGRNRSSDWAAQG